MDAAGQDEPVVALTRVFSSSLSGSDSFYKVNETLSDDDSDDEDDATWGEELESKGRKTVKGKRSPAAGAKRNDMHSGGHKSSKGKRSQTPNARYLELRSKAFMTIRSTKRSTAGARCHYCRQKRVEPHVSCSYCPVKFCGRCLLNRHGERIRDEMRKNVRWVCPRCRGGCGRGCETCCTCVNCRKTWNLEPTKQLLRAAKADGFSNVHDYLIHRQTGEDAAAIARRKERRGWTSASCLPTSPIDDEEVTDCAWVGKRKRSKRKDAVFNKRVKRIEGTSVRVGSNDGDRKHDIVERKKSYSDGGSLLQSCKKEHETEDNLRNPECQLIGSITINRISKMKNEDQSNEKTEKSRTESVSLSPICQGETRDRDSEPQLASRSAGLDRTLLDKVPLLEIDCPSLSHDPKAGAVSGNTTLNSAESCDCEKARSRPPCQSSQKHNQSDGGGSRSGDSEQLPGNRICSGDAVVVKEQQGRKTGQLLEDALGSSHGLTQVRSEVVVKGSSSLPFDCKPTGNIEDKAKQGGIDLDSTGSLQKDTGISSLVDVAETKCGNSVPKMRGSISTLDKDQAAKLKLAVSRITGKLHSHGRSRRHLLATRKGVAKNALAKERKVKTTATEVQQNDCSVYETKAQSKRDNEKYSICQTLDSDSLTQKAQCKSTKEVEDQKNSCSVNEMTTKSKKVDDGGGSTDHRESQVDKYSVSKRLDSHIFEKLNAVSTSPGKSCISTPMQSNKFREELELLFKKPFSESQLRRLWEYTCREPQVRQRGESFEELSADSGTYLDRYPELAKKMIRESSPVERLKLLRGFFFWIQHARIEGAYMPWVTEDDETDDKDFLDISGKESEAISFLLAIDPDQK